MDYFKNSLSKSSFVQKVGEQVKKVKTYFEEEAKKLQDEQAQLKQQQKEEETLERIRQSNEFSKDTDDNLMLENAFKVLQQHTGDPEKQKEQKVVLLPWQGIDIKNNQQGVEMHVKDEILKLSKDPNKFLIDDLQFEFDFDFDRYIYVAQILIKVDPNLKNIRQNLVPSKIEEDQFWKVYFYQIEVIKAQFGLQNKLGRPIQHWENQKLIELEEINKNQNNDQEEQKQQDLADDQVKQIINKPSDSIQQQLDEYAQFEMEISEYLNQKD